MPPNEGFLGTKGFKHAPSNLDAVQIGGEIWLQNKRGIDGAEGLWRVHNDLYDLQTFIKSHPGGSQWIEMTQGTDITEAFEVHHLTDKADQVLKKYFVRKAKETPRNSPYTFKDDGFYRTLKRNIRPVLEKAPKKLINTTALYSDVLLLSLFLISTLAAINMSYTLAIFAGVILSCVATAGHNYFHQKDNFRMYYFNFSLMQYREWRISHALSHHLYTNTIADLEVTSLQPAVQFFSRTKTFSQRYISWIYWPLFWPFIFPISAVSRVIAFFFLKDKTAIQTSDWVPFSLPLAMYIFSGQSLLSILPIWLSSICAASAYFVFISVTHHHPDIFHDGDTPRKDTDWGLAQLDAVMDRKEFAGSHLMVLTSFGDHALHHLFPTLDHGILQTLYPVFRKTMKDFKVEARHTTQFELIKGHFQQMARTKPHEKPVDLLDKKYFYKL